MFWEALVFPSTFCVAVKTQDNASAPGSLVL